MCNIVTCFAYHCMSVFKAVVIVSLPNCPACHVPEELTCRILGKNDIELNF